MQKALGIAFILILLSGCSTQRFAVNEPIGPAGQPIVETSQPFFIGGVGQQQELNAAEVCGGPSLVASIETEQSFLDGLFSALTAGIYTPRTARVYCLVEIEPG